MIYDNKRDTTRHFRGIVTGFKRLITSDGVNPLYFMFKERDFISPFVKILYKFVRTFGRRSRWKNIYFVNGEPN